EEETKKLQAQKTDLVNTTRFIIPDSRPDLKNMSCGPWQAAESGIFREGRYFGEKWLPATSQCCPPANTSTWKPGQSASACPLNAMENGKILPSTAQWSPQRAKS
ncbi:hypothetical protein, partial [Lacticaseibacillus rhamnosus]|uniref:hypothetical protein n=1 Tax=Lacticaseibacillus rhamnosus TaxID=47715 RepID=UPI001CDD57D5